jgi:hypothetical protein
MRKLCAFGDILEVAPNYFALSVQTSSSVEIYFDSRRRRWVGLRLLRSNRCLTAPLSASMQAGGS